MENKEQDNVELTLSLNPDSTLQAKERNSDLDLMQKEIAQLPPLKKGDVDMHGSYVIPMEDKVVVGFYIRNGLPNAVRFNRLPLVVTNDKKEVMAKQEVDLSKLGEIPSHNVRPGEIYFDRKNINVDEFPQEDWSIDFESKPKANRFVKLKSIVLPKKFSKEQMKAVNNYVKALPPLRPNTVDISPLKVKVREDGKLIATVIIRNGNRRSVNLNKLNLAVRDAKQREVAAAPFKLGNLSVEPASAHLLSLAFSPENITKGDMDLSRWTIHVKKDMH